MYKKTVLDNGLRLLTEVMPHTRSVSINFFIGTGSRYEDDMHAGISHFIEHLCFRGTLKRPTARDISAAIEGTGGVLNGGTDKELTVYWCKVAQPHFTLALDVLSDVLLGSRFDPADIEKERQVISEEINMCNDSPGQRVEILIDELLWPGHPLGRDIAGSKESIAAITRDMMLDFLAAQYQPANTVLSIAGNIQHDEVVNAVNRVLGGWESQQKALEYTAHEEQPNRRLLVETRETEQVHLSLALPGLSLFHPRRYELGLLNIILGEGMSSRLFTEIRDKLGLAYSIHSYAEHFSDTGSLTISAGVETGRLEIAVEAILGELARLRETIPEPEVTKAKELFKGRLLLRMEDSRSVAGWMGGQEILTGRVLGVDEVVAIIEAITAEQLQQIASEILVGEKLRLAVVGPVEQEEALVKLLKI